MPQLKKPKTFEPLWKEWDYLANKKGLHHTVYSVNGDQYTGDWLNNKKHGRQLFFYKINLFKLVISSK